LLCKEARVSEDDVFKFWEESGNVAKYGPNVFVWRYWIQMHGGLEGIFKD